jgi:2-hydroxycyclohexanecarboxyl-CoA dehydrogenase
MIVVEPRKVALVTGGGAGIGEAACLRLARDGMGVGVLGRRRENVVAVANAIIAAGGEAIPLVANVADRTQIDAAVGKLRAELGPITILVNNAGIEEITPFSEIDEAAWDQVMAVNLKGTYFATQAVLPDMLAAGWGRIVNLTALGAQIGAANITRPARAA